MDVIRKERADLERELRVEKRREKGKKRADRQKARSLEAKLGLENTKKRN